MAFGDTLRLAYQQASELQRESAKRVAAGMDWVGKQSDAIAAKANQQADWLAKRTDEEVRRGAAAAQERAAAAERKAREFADAAMAAAQRTAAAAQAKAKTTAQAVKHIYQQAKKVATQAVSTTATTTCAVASKALQAANHLLDRGLDNAAARNRKAEDDSKWELKSKRGVEADRRRYKHAGSEEPPGALEKKLELKVETGAEKSVLYYGDEDLNLKVGVHKSALAVGYEHDFNNNREIFGLYREEYFAGAKVSAKGSTAKGLVETSGQVEALSAKATGMVGYVHGNDFKGVKAEIGAEANLIKGGASGQINITPKTIYDNTLGRAVGLVKPEWSALSERWDHGVFIGAEGEIGVGAAAKGVAQFNAQQMSVKAGGLIGFGPMAGVYAIFGIK